MKKSGPGHPGRKHTAAQQIVDVVVSLVDLSVWIDATIGLFRFIVGLLWLLP